MKKIGLLFMALSICVLQIYAQDTLWYYENNTNHKDRIGLIMQKSTDGYFRLSFTDSTIAFGRLFMGLELKLKGDNLLYRSRADSMHRERILLNPLMTELDGIILYSPQDSVRQDGLLFYDSPDSTFLTSFTRRISNYKTNYQNGKDKFTIYHFLFFDHNWAEAMPYPIGFTPSLGLIYFGFDPPVYKGPYTGKIYYLDYKEVDKLKKIW